LSLLNISINGLETFTEEYTENELRIMQAIPDALEYLGSEMQSSLANHLQIDWYAAYKPEVYKRRSDGYGVFPGLTDDIYFDRGVTGMTLRFEYSPSGAYVPDALHTRDGDELIEAIQTGELMGDPPPRPFWNNFVKDMESGGFFNGFSAGFSKEFPLISTPGEIVLDGDEYLRGNVGI